MSFMLVLWSECFQEFADASSLSDFRHYSVEKDLKEVKIQMFSRFEDLMVLNVAAQGDFEQEEVVQGFKCCEGIDGLRGAHGSLSGM